MWSVCQKDEIWEDWAQVCFPNVMLPNHVTNHILSMVPQMFSILPLYWMFIFFVLYDIFGFLPKISIQWTIFFSRGKALSCLSVCVGMRIAVITFVFS